MAWSHLSKHDSLANLPLAAPRLGELTELRDRPIAFVVTAISDRALLELDRAVPSGALLRDRELLETCSRDESETPGVLPDAVIRVQSTEQVSRVMKVAHAHRIPVTPRAAGTGRSGGAIPVEGGLVLAFDQMNTIKGVESEDLIAVAEPGAILGDIHRAAEAETLFYPPDPNSWTMCTIGGNIAENAGGPRAFKYGVTREYVLGVQAVMADGTILQLGRRTLKGVTGYDLTSLIVGSEGTLALVTEATLQVIPLPQTVVTVMALFRDEECVRGALKATTQRGIVPRCAELLDAETLAVVRKTVATTLSPDARAMILFELDGAEHEVMAQLERMGEALDGAGAMEVLVADDPVDREKLWEARRSLSYAMRRQAKYKLAEDIVVPRTRIADLLRWLPELPVDPSLRAAAYGHVGDGNIHVNLLWDDDAQVPLVGQTVERLFQKVIAFGGTLTGEHGVGTTKLPYLAMEQSPEVIALQRRIKKTFDPLGILNPGKIFSTDRPHGPC